MKRSAAIKALDAAFDETFSLAYRNRLVDPLGADRPDRGAIKEAFERALRINIEAYAMALKAINENPDLED